MYDVVVSIHSIEEACELQKQLQLSLRSAGFELRNSAVLLDLEFEFYNCSLLSFKSTEDQFLKILGLCWYSQLNSFRFQVNPLERDCTKRIILSELARTFEAF